VALGSCSYGAGFNVTLQVRACMCLWLCVCKCVRVHGHVCAFGALRAVPCIFVQASLDGATPACGAASGGDPEDDVTGQAVNQCNAQVWVE
jgi:hypothetical protein